jgi:DNA-binding NtrC family response regulator
MVSSRVAGGTHSVARALRDVIATAETDAIVAALGRHGGDRDSAAQDLGISRSYFDARSAALGLGAAGTTPGANP